MFGSRKKVKKHRSIRCFRRGDIQIKQYTTVTYLGCELDQYLSSESMLTKVLGKIHGRLKFMYRKQSFLSSSLRRMLCNSLMQPHFDYACSAWYPNLNKTYTQKVQISQNKFVDCQKCCGKSSDLSPSWFSIFLLKVS